MEVEDTMGEEEQGGATSVGRGGTRPMNVLLQEGVEVGGEGEVATVGHGVLQEGEGVGVEEGEEVVVVVVGGMLMWLHHNSREHLSSKMATFRLAEEVEEEVVVVGEAEVVGEEEVEEEVVMAITLTSRAMVVVGTRQVEGSLMGLEEVVEVEGDTVEVEEDMVEVEEGEVPSVEA